ncbi:MAG: DUF3368 domain-containing protein, partial [bacterium]|nr:DUF3368 domain-containing protein [bacterium]
NTSPLLYLHQVGHLDLLHDLYGTVLSTPAVEKELLVGSAKGVNVPKISQLSWLTVQALKDPTLLPTITDLGPGEAEIIALGLQHRDALLILDDRLGRRIARLNGLAYTGTLGVLTRAKQAGHLASVSPVLDALRETNMWLDDAVIRMVLAEANELKST